VSSSWLDPRSLDLVIAEAITYWAEIRAQGRRCA